MAEGSQSLYDNMKTPGEHQEDNYVIFNLPMCKGIQPKYSTY